MVKTIEQDLLKSNCEIILQNCNCFNTMNSGIALVLKRKWHEVYDVDCLTKSGDKDKLGTFTIAKINDRTTKTKEIINIYGQYTYGGAREVDYEAVYSGLEGVLKYVIARGYKSIGIPYKMASDRAGGDFRIIEMMINVVFENWDGDVIICKLPIKNIALPPKEILETGFKGQRLHGIVIDEWTKIDDK